MVLPGQYLERPALIPCGTLVLEGLSHRGTRRPPLLVCPPLRGGGGMDAPAVAELAWASARAGHASLRFQHRGRGASQGVADPALALDDAQAALEHLEATCRGVPAVAGVGDGCATAWALAHARGAAGLALLAPAGWSWLERGGAGQGLEAPGLPVLLVLPALAPEPPPAGLVGHGGLVKVERVAGADAGFAGGLARAGRVVADWLATLDGAGAPGR